jgi:hypothetical protein
MAAAISRTAAVFDMLDVEIREGDRVCRLTPTRNGFAILGAGEVVAFESGRVRWLDDEGFWHVSTAGALKVVRRSKGECSDLQRRGLR